MSSSCNKEDSLQKTLEILNTRLLETRSQLRRTKRNISRKRTVLLDSRGIFQNELADAFALDPMFKQRKRIRLEPPPGLVPLISQQQPLIASTDTQSSSSSSSSSTIPSLHITSCLASVIDETRVCLQLTAENASSVSLAQVHIHPTSNDVYPLPSEICRNAQYNVPPGQSTVLYGAFTLLNDVPFEGMQQSLGAACHYVDGYEEAWHVTNMYNMTWEDSVDRLLSRDALPIFYPCHAKIQVFDPDLSFLDTLPEDERILVAKDRRLAIVRAGGEADILHVYGISERIVAQCLLRLHSQGKVRNIACPPFAPRSTTLDFINSLQDEISYLETNQKQNILAARENTTTLLCNLLQHCDP